MLGAAMTENHTDKKLVAPEELGRVVVLYGGTSSERDVSLNSGKAVCDGLLEAGVDAVLLDVDENPAAQLKSIDIDVAFIALHGVGGEDGSIQSILEAHAVPYTGSGVSASAIAIDKLRTKQMWQALGFPTSEFKVLSEDSDWAAVLSSLSGKVMVKPVREGSSVGMSIATTEKELEQAYLHARELDSSVIAERWLSGREFTVAVLGDEALPVVEMRTDQDFYTYDAKYHSNTTQYLCPAPISDELAEQMRRICAEAFSVLGCRGWGRVDLMQDADERIYLLEANTSPGMTSHSLVPIAAKQAGMSFSELVLRVTQLAMTVERR